MVSKLGSALPDSPAALAASLKASGLAPFVAAACAVRHDGVWRREVGGDAGTLFDLASLTKPMTAVTVALSGLSRHAKLGELCPELQDTRSGAATVEALLSHRAGLVAHVSLYLPLTVRDPVDPSRMLREAANGVRDECLDGDAGPFAPVYSDLGYALAGKMLATHTSSIDAGDAIERLLVPRLEADLIGTARGLTRRGVEMGKAAPTEDVSWRGLVTGQVHDENAWALTGLGGSGHAGMFGTAEAVLRFGEAVLDGLGGHGDVDLAWLVEERKGGTLRAGFDGKSPEGSSAGQRFGPRSFGHLGFTGTSLWIDPDAQVVAVLLTNRVWPSRERAADAIRAARPTAHDALHSLATRLAAKSAPEH